ncbi:hypothetical protein C8J57DRAFT_1244461 [Mycena rebaudengoi]|nr:hypothetical protein C8J57DRAFT_1244461 [Mycena rebaudengoi]
MNFADFLPGALLTAPRPSTTLAMSCCSSVAARTSVYARPSPPTLQKQMAPLILLITGATLPLEADTIAVLTRAHVDTLHTRQSQGLTQASALHLRTGLVCERQFEYALEAKCLVDDYTLIVTWCRSTELRRGSGGLSEVWSGGRRSECMLQANPAVIAVRGGVRSLGGHAEKAPATTFISSIRPIYNPLRFTSPNTRWIFYEQDDTHSFCVFTVATSVKPNAVRVLNATHGATRRPNELLHPEAVIILAQRLYTETILAPKLCKSAQPFFKRKMLEVYRMSITHFKTPSTFSVGVHTDLY